MEFEELKGVRALNALFFATTIAQISFRLRTMNPTPAFFPGFEYSSHLLY